MLIIMILFLYYGIVVLFLYVNPCADERTCKCIRVNRTLVSKETYYMINIDLLCVNVEE